MKNIIKTLVALAFIVVPLACSDFLNTTPPDRVSAPTTWKDGPLAQAFVFGSYGYMGYGGFEEQMLASYTDEAMFTHAGRGINVFTEGTEGPPALASAPQAWTSGTYAWPSMFEALRAANTAIINLPDAPFTDIDKNMLLGEAYFLRAYYYHQLLRFYGGVPIIDKLYGLNEDYSIERSSFAQCVDFIVNDCETAAELLDGKTMPPSRASKQAALALKARVLLYAASDLHDIPTASANSNVIASYATPEIVGYTSGDRTARWQAAKDAAKAVMDAGTGYKMNLSAPVSQAEGIANYVALSMGGASKVVDAAAASDLIFVRSETGLFTAENNWPLGGIHFGINNGPNGYHNWAGNTPIQQLVDDYEMMDGSKFDWDDPVQGSDPYNNRDPRFYATILYDGAEWKPRPSDVAAIDPVNEVQTGYYDNGSGGKINGVDTRESAIENWNGSRTHYYVRKFIDPDPSIVENQSGFQVVPWPFIRYTEMVLNYVEACIELGQDAEAQSWLNKIRFRAGMPAVNEAGTALRDRYRNERRIELVYEEHRYHDARRWMIPATTVGRGIKSIHIDAVLKAGATPNIPYRYDKTKYDYIYTVEDNTSNETRQWVDKMYYRPIALDEMSKNKKLVQNPGY